MCFAMRAFTQDAVPHDNVSATAALTEEIFPLVYDELRRVAAAQLSGEPLNQTLQPTELVHEAYLRLIGIPSDDAWKGRGHFFAAAAEAMRRIVIEHARKRRNRERLLGKPLPLEHLPQRVKMSNADLLRLDETISQLEKQDELAAKIVKLRFFGGMTMPETASALELPLRTAERYWAYARSWLYREFTAEN
jgi:RNA polymerase sigma factor (TIGR02999 family)